MRFVKEKVCKGSYSRVSEHLPITRLKRPLYAIEDTVHDAFWFTYDNVWRHGFAHGHALQHDTPWVLSPNEHPEGESE